MVRIRRARGIAIVLVGLLFSLGGLAIGQSFVVGIITLSETMQPTVDGFMAALDDYVSHAPDASVTYLFNGPTPLEGMLAEAQRLIAANANVLFAITTPATAAALEATKINGIPVVFAVVTDPVESGFVANLTNPGANLTGVRSGGGIGKELEWLLQVAPHVRRLYVPHNPNDGGAVTGMAELVPAADKLGIELIVPVVTTTEALLESLAILPEGIDALFLNGSGWLNAQIDAYVRSSLENRLPLASVCACIDSGVLLSYGHDWHQDGVQAARLVHQIFHGALPSELPVETATFYLGINLATADAIGLMIDDDILDQADFIAR